MKQTTWAVAIALVGAFLVGPIEASATVIFSASGADAAAIQTKVSDYRAALGGNNGPNPPPPAPDPSGRREINWDGGGPPVINGTAPVTPFTTFQNSRGATFTTPGTGLTQAAATGPAGTLLSLDLINPQYATLFAPFSANRLFAPIGSNVTEGFFSIPGTNGTVPAGVRGFGAVFSDVDLSGTTIQYFDVNGNSLGVFPVPTFTGNQTFSFLGITRDSSETLIGSVRIVTGTSALGPNESSTLDLVVMDDFIYGEPQRIPQPSSMQLLGAALLAVAAMSRFTRGRITR
jgi:hypothetical protein